jgi:uncharacterized protein YndB with AHSA1/START domain
MVSEHARVAGAPLRFQITAVEIPPMEGEMIAFEPPTLLAFSWGPDVLRFELRPDGEGTELVFTVALEELGKAARDGAGWHVCLEQLAFELADEQVPAYSGDHWRELNNGYAGRLGPEAATIGPPQEWEAEYGGAD